MPLLTSEMEKEPISFSKAGQGPFLIYLLVIEVAGFVVIGDK